MGRLWVNVAASRNDDVTKNFNLKYGPFNPLTLTFELDVMKRLT